MTEIILGEQKEKCIAILKPETIMSNKSGDFMALVEAGKIKEAKAMLEAEKVKAEYEPDTITSVVGKPPLFTKRGKPVELGDDGIWRPKPEKTEK